MNKTDSIGEEAEGLQETQRVLWTWYQSIAQNWRGDLHVTYGKTQAPV